MNYEEKAREAYEWLLQQPDMKAKMTDLTQFMGYKSFGVQMSKIVFHLECMYAAHNLYHPRQLVVTQYRVYRLVFHATVPWDHKNANMFIEIRPLNESDCEQQETRQVLTYKHILLSRRFNNEVL
jgi:hypothetical protein